MADFIIKRGNVLLRYKLIEHGMERNRKVFLSNWNWYCTGSLCSIVSPNPFDAIFPFGSYITLLIYLVWRSLHTPNHLAPPQKIMLSVGETELFYNLPDQTIFKLFRLLGILSCVLDIFPKVYFFISMTIICLIVTCEPKTKMLIKF